MCCHLSAEWPRGQSGVSSWQTTNKCFRLSPRRNRMFWKSAGRQRLRSGPPLPHGEGAQRVEARGRRLHRDVVVLRLIRQGHEAGGVLLGKMIKALANHLNANRLGGAMKYIPCWSVLSLAPCFSWVLTNEADASRFNGFNARGKPQKSFRGWDFLSPPDARLKPGADENQFTGREKLFRLGFKIQRNNLELLLTSEFDNEIIVCNQLCAVKTEDSRLRCAFKCLEFSCGNHSIAGDKRFG